MELFFRHPKHEEVIALNNISFHLEKGKSLGLVGVNGAGKSTLLKIIAGTTFPTRGFVQVKGRVAAILELGMGFHGDFSGWENAVLNASLLGLSSQETQKVLPKIAEFSELGDYLNHPLKTYSTGMVMRLAFAVATHVDPDILIIDEALAVGDGYYQKKCVDKIRSFREQGKTILLCSHALYYIDQLCDEALWIHDGKIKKAGSAPEVVHDYEVFLLEKEAQEKAEAHQRREGLPGFIEEVKILTEKPSSCQLLMTFRAEKPTLAFRLGVVFDHPSGIPFFSSVMEKPVTGKTLYHVELHIPSLPMVKGEYDVAVFLMDESALSIYDEWRKKRALCLKPTNFSVGYLHIPHTWRY